jgi:hypothetical protein
MIAETPKKSNPWVKLHLVPQTENNSAMPPFIIGKLESETPSSYVLSRVIERVETSEAFQYMERKAMDFINRTYVWRVEILTEMPTVDELNASEAGKYFDDDDGGLG